MLCAVGLQGGEFREGEWLRVCLVLCMTDGSLCGSIVGRCVRVFAQVHATGMEISPVSPLSLEFVIILFFFNIDFSLPARHGSVVGH